METRFDLKKIANFSPLESLVDETTFNSQSLDKINDFLQLIMLYNILSMNPWSWPDENRMGKTYFLW